MNKLLVGIKGGIINESINLKWELVNAHGKLEYDNGYGIPLFNNVMPTEEGYYIAYTEYNIAVLIHLVRNKNGIMVGLCCFIDDYYSLKHINSPEKWE